MSTWRDDSGIGEIAKLLGWAQVPSGIDEESYWTRDGDGRVHDNDLVDAVVAEIAKIVRMRREGAGRGHLEIGINFENNVVINFPGGITGWMQFTPEEAEHLGNLLLERASTARAVLAAMIEGSKKRQP